MDGHSPVDGNYALEALLSLHGDTTGVVSPPAVSIPESVSEPQGWRGPGCCSGAGCPMPTRTLGAGFPDRAFE